MTRWRAALLFAAAAAAPAAQPGAAVSDLLPRPVENGASVELFASWERDENSSASRSAEWTDSFLREKVTFYSNGFVYHPRFLQYQASIAGAVKQEDYDATFTPSPGWRSDSGLEYDGRLFFLPEHPYNLELYGVRYEPLFKEQAATQRNNVESSQGALFRYRKKPWFFDARFIHSSLESRSIESDVSRSGVNGEYFKRWDSGRQFTLTGGYNPSRFTNSLGVRGTSTERFLTPVLDLGRARLSMSASKNDVEQTSAGSGDFRTDQLSFYELLSLHLPARFRTDLSYRIQDNTSQIGFTGGAREQELEDLSRVFELDVIHRLYESLDSRYTLRHSDRESTNGDSLSLTHNLQTSYTKRIPRGRVQLGSYVGRGDTENVGRTDIVSEPHAGAAVPGTFLLLQSFAEADTVDVFLRSPLPPFDVVRLDEMVHYTLTVVGNNVQVNLLALPPQFTVPGTYDLFVNYAIESGDFELRSRSFGANASVQLLDDLLTPYAGYGIVRFRDVSGNFTGVPLDTTTWTGGMLVHKGPVRGRAEYQTVDWDVNPYRSWRGEVQVVSAIDARTRVYGTLSHLNKRYSGGSGGFFEDPYTEASTTLSGSLQKQIPGRNMLASAGGSYARLDGLVDSTAWSVNGSLSWRIGRLDLAVGASAYRSESEGTGAEMIERDEQYYYIKLRRDLF